MRHLHPFVALLLALGLGAAACSSDASVEDDAAAAPAGSPAGHGSARASDVRCGEHETGLSRTLSSGAKWQLCLRVDAKRGMVLSKVSLTPPGARALLVAHEVSLAQLEVPYDTGARLTEDITGAGFGGVKMQDLTSRECAGELLGVDVPTIGDGSTFGETPTRTVLCSEVTDAGLAYRSSENGELVTARKDAWSLTTVSKVGWYEYLARYTFGADGSITPGLGATGDLSPVDWSGDARQGSALAAGHDGHAASHAHNAVWRIHWALGDGPLAVEQYDAAATGTSGKEAPVVSGGLHPLTKATTAQRADRRWWRVLSPSVRNDDGHPVSYEIDLGASDAFTFVEDASHGQTRGYDVAFTNADECAVFASGNDEPCGDGVPDYVARDIAPLTDVVSWIAVGFHHVPRDEDQSPMELHWQGFRLTPRDVTATRMDLPPQRKGRNGQPDTYEGTPLEELTDLEAQ